MNDSTELPKRLALDSSVFIANFLAHGSAVFARREKDIAEEMKKRPFQVELVFLDNLAGSSSVLL